MRSHLALLFLLPGCLNLGSLPAAPPALHVVSVTAGSPTLDRIGRVPVIRIHFDHPVAPPEANAVVLVTGEPSSTLQTDVTRSPLPATLTSRQVDITVARDPLDPMGYTVVPTAPLLPDTPLVLLVTPAVRGTDTALFEDNDGGLHAMEFPLEVAPARQCGAVLTLPAVGGVFPLPSRLLVQFDRPVQPLGTAAIQVLVAGWPVPTQWSLDCLQPNGYATCAWSVPAISMGANIPVSIRAVGLVTHNGIAPENTPTVVLNSSPPAALVPLGPAPVCSDGEMADGPACVSASTTWITLRASTQAVTVLRAQATPIAPVAPDAGVTAAALSSPGSLHTLALEGLNPSTTYAVTLAPALEPRSPIAWALGLVTTPASELPVRITEVLCHPLGGSAQAYVEIANDGTTDADLSGWTLRMETHRVTLPDGATVPAQARSVVVGDDFNPLGIPDQGDPPVVPGAGVIVITGTLSGHGLPSTGSDIALEDTNGTMVSFVPGSNPQRAPQLGVGLVRAALDLADSDPAAWSWDADGSCTPGGPDRLR